ncbi:MAG: phosphonate ABC transporter, permease protein PhnE [Cytophagales bacterium]|nr:phosphonate ABC transporter, permease protein PhnE [Cytophagales bacterium]
MASTINTSKPFGYSASFKIGSALFAILFVLSASRLELTWDRFVLGLGNAAKFLHKMFPPIFTPSSELIKGMTESLEIAILASAIGVLLSIPVAIAGARNLMPAVVTWPVRVFVTLCRTFHPVIVAILFVKAVGFGALAGVLALTVASIGFLGKLLTEAIEEISMKQIEAIKATGAPFMSVLTFAVLPQVLYRLIGFIAYETDSNLRNSTMIGIVGAGGIGGTLFSAFQRYDYDYVFGIVLCIIALISIGEVLQLLVKRVFQQ